METASKCSFSPSGGGGSRRVRASENELAVVGTGGHLLHGTDVASLCRRQTAQSSGHAAPA